jgi:molybdopterin/thiamine biosynthesis adenylyltransferase
MLPGRLDRQLRIEGWDQGALDQARVGVVGDDDLLASWYVMAASALGLNRLVVVAPRLDAQLFEVAQALNPGIKVTYIEGFYTHPILHDLFGGCNVIIDLSRYGLANKLLLAKALDDGVPTLRGFCFEEGHDQGFKLFTYVRGRDWQELEEVVAGENLPGDHPDDPVLDMIVTGIALEETKNILMGHPVSEEVIGYRRRRLATVRRDPVICVVGAGALGNFVGLGLGYSRFRNITFMDPDVVDVTNLNRQLLLVDGVGMRKAEELGRKLDELFGMKVKTCVGYFTRDTKVSEYDIIFDCVDNYETRIVLSERCKEEGKILISGGTGPEAGQVIVYDPRQGSETPAELLGLYGIVEGRAIEAYRRDRASCAYQPEPSVIMVNQIIGGFMVETCRMLLDGQKPGNIFYDSRSDRKW